MFVRYDLGTSKVSKWHVAISNLFCRQVKFSGAEFTYFIDGGLSLCHSDKTLRRGSREKTKGGTHGRRDSKESERTEGCGCWTWLCGPSYCCCLRQAGEGHRIRYQ